MSSRRLNRSAAAALSLVFAASSSPAPLSAELLKNFRIGGQIDVQATSGKNIRDFATQRNPAPGAANNNDRIGDAQTRVMIHLDWDLLDDVHSRITLRKSDRNYGTIGGVNPETNTSQRVGDGSGGSDVLANIYVDEAHFKVDKVAGIADLTLGRQFYGEAGDIVIYYGPSDKGRYGLPTSSIDAVRLDWNSEWFGLAGLAGKTNGSAIGITPQADTDVRGINLAFKGNEHIRGALYAWNQVTHRTAAAQGLPASNSNAGGLNDHLWVLGIKARLAAAGFWLRGEYAQNLGNRRITGSTTQIASSRYLGLAVLANGGFKGESDSLGMLSLWGEFALGSGDRDSRSNRYATFTPINADYRPGSIYGRFGTTLAAGVAAAAGTTVPTGSSALSNRVIWGAGLRMSPAVANKLVFGASWWDFRVHNHQTANNAAKPFRGNEHIGSELDIDMIWTHSENVAFAAGWGTFQPGGLIKQSVRAAVASAAIGGRVVSPATLVYFDTRVRF